MSTVTRSMSAEELIQLPRGRARYELVRGELQTMSLSGSKHGAVSARLALLVGQFVDAHQLGVVFGSQSGYLVERNPDTVLAPDLSFIRNERIPKSGLPDAYWPGSPDLVVEGASPNDSKARISEKPRNGSQQAPESYGMSIRWLAPSRFAYGEFRAGLFQRTTC